MMKSLVIVSLLMVGALAQAKSNQTNQQFQCANTTFREARFDVLSNKIFIQDSFIQGIDQLEAIVGESLGTEGKINIQQVALEAFKDASECTTILAPVVNCTTQSENALLHINGTIASSSGLSGYVSLVLFVKLNKLDVLSHLSSEGGPIDLGDDVTVVPVNRVNLEATAEVVLNGKTVTLKWTPNFNNGESSSDSYCKQIK